MPFPACFFFQLERHKSVTGQNTRRQNTREKPMKSKYLTEYHKDKIPYRNNDAWHYFIGVTELDICAKLTMKFFTHYWVTCIFIGCITRPTSFRGPPYMSAFVKTSYSSEMTRRSVSLLHWGHYRNFIMLVFVPAVFYPYGLLTM